MSARSRRGADPAGDERAAQDRLRDEALRFAPVVADPEPMPPGAFSPDDVVTRVAAVEPDLVSDLADDRGAGLGHRAARGAVKTMAGQATQVLLQTTSTIVLARLLSPHDYGLYAIVVVVVGVGEIFRDFGLSSAAIQSKVLTRGQRDNLFWANTGIGAVLMLLMLLSAPLIGAVFHQPDLVGIARALSVTFLVNGLATQFRAGLTRQMRFGWVAGADLLGQLAAVSVAIACAAAGAHYWALVGSQLAQVTTILLVVASVARWVPGLPDRDASIRPFLRFGWHFFATQVINYAGSNLDSLTIAVRFGPGSVGIYNRAFQLLMTPLNQVRIPATTIALPVLSRLQDDYERSGHYLRRGQITLGYTLVAGLSVVVGAAGPLVGLLLGDKWHEVVPILALLAVAASFNLLAFVGYWAYVSRGLTATLFRYSLVALAISAVCILIGSHWGLVGVAAGYATAPGIAWPISLWWLSRATPVPTAALYAGAGRILVMAAFGAGASAAACAALSGGPQIVQLLGALLATAAVYALAGAVVPIVRRDLQDVLAVVRRVVR